MNQASAFDAFLASVERRAFLHARFALRNDQSALDVVQDAMMRLAERYADRPSDEWPMLFQRILQNAIRDQFRRQKVRDTWTALVSNLMPRHVSEDEQLSRIGAAIDALPARQREAFLLRYWEGHDIVETAELMGCSEGSVKTHCSRASQALARALSDLAPDP
ncbi:MAG: sigma-70 family RNA polymerase sigma factor [Betaproteobacteria bacterium]|nr:sigma-70 family RNA polymerase sigma factor [Betaproteobacteria bacterium]